MQGDRNRAFGLLFILWASQRLAANQQALSRGAGLSPSASFPVTHYQWAGRGGSQGTGKEVSPWQEARGVLDPLASLLACWTGSPAAHLAVVQGQSLRSNPRFTHSAPWLFQPLSEEHRAHWVSSPITLFPDFFSSPSAYSEDSHRCLYSSSTNSAMNT